MGCGSVLLYVCVCCRARVQLVLGANAAVDQVDSEGDTPLITACNEGHGECVQLLIAAHATLDKANVNSATPLLLACSNGPSRNDGHIECTRQLLAARVGLERGGTIGLAMALLAEASLIRRRRSSS